MELISPPSREQPQQLIEVRGAACTSLIDKEYERSVGVRLREAPPDTWPEMAKVKSSTVCQVLKGEISAKDGASHSLHIKLFRPATLSDRARDAVRGSRAANEFANLREARAKGLPAVKPIAHGKFTQSTGARSFLITESKIGAQSLPRGAIGAALAFAAGSLLRQAHDAGLHARDLHPGNMLDIGGDELVLVDLTSASLANPLETSERARALAYFCQDLDGNLSDPAAAPLARGYGASEDLIDLATRQGRRLRNRSLSAFGRRATRPCRHTAIEGLRARKLCLHLPARDLHAAAKKWRLNDAENRELKSGRRGAVYLNGDLLIKQRNPAAARKLFIASYWLLFAKVPCPEPVALRLEHKIAWFFARRLHHPNLLCEFHNDCLTHEDLRKAAYALGLAVGRLHGHGLRNRDLKFENLIRDPKTNTVYMVDLDGLRRHLPTDSRGQAADLGRLLASYRCVCKEADPRVVRAFVRGYSRAHKCLRMKPAANLYRHTEARAKEWARAHAQTSTSD